MKLTEYKCPLCQTPMESHEGDGINRANGFTLVCTFKLCPCHENVYGHGKTEKDAFEIACLKFQPAKK
jgi:hypothetical protein